MLMRSIETIQLVLVAGLLSISAQDLFAQSQQPGQGNQKPSTQCTLALPMHRIPA